MKKLWEILVPEYPDHCHTVNYPAKQCHEEWDKKVSEIAGGVSILKSLKGRWHFAGKLWKENMIRVRIAATEEEMDKIAFITAQHYKQKGVMYYLISDKVVIKEY